MRITVICVGKIKEKFYTDALAEYRKRLSKYCKLEIVELADEKTKENASVHEIELVKAKEGERILSAIKDDMYVIALEKLGLSGSSHVAFVIGGSLGLDSRVLNRADMKLSFSKMTFPHQLMRVILLEQIYRAYRIMTGAPYHK